MSYLYKTDNISGYEKDFRVFFQNLVDLSKKFKNYVSERVFSPEINYSKNTDDLIKIAYPILVEDFFIKADNIASNLKENHLVIDEYHDFLEILRIMKLILKENIEDNDINELKILETILKTFISITEFKFELINTTYDIDKNIKINLEDLTENNQKEYIRRYNEFSMGFFNQTNEFYSYHKRETKNKEELKKILNQIKV